MEPYSLAYYAAVLQDLHDVFAPHAGQVIVGKSLFYDGTKMTFLQCGRKFGKTTFCIYALYRYALTFPGSSCYYFAPFLKQAKEIIWADKSLQHFLPPSIRQKYGVTENANELRISFNNGSFIKVEGADNAEAVAGINPHFAVIDELKDISEDFWNIFEPNVISHSAPLLIVGSPPDNHDNLYCRLADECKRGYPSKIWFKMPSSKNPHISKDFLEEKRKALIARGEPEIWSREYLANIVVGGAKFIFPMIEESYIHPYDYLLSKIKEAPKEWEFYVSFDPGTTSTFAVLLVAINKYSKHVYLMDEVYEQDQSKTTASLIFERARLLWREINPSDMKWNKIYDYAAAWFELDVSLQFDEALMPCLKDLKSKENKLSLIKQVMLDRKLFFSDRCVKTYWEMQVYRKDDKGRIPKENDHLIDNLRYIMNASCYFGNERDMPIVRTDKRGIKLDLDEIRRNDEADAFEYITSEYYY